MGEYSKESVGAGIMLFQKALKTRRSLISRYKKCVRAAKRGDTKPASEAFLSEFYNVEKLLVVTLKELDGAKLRLPKSGNNIRIMETAGSISGSSLTEEAVSGILKGLPYTILQRELEMLPCCTRLALFNKLDLTLERKPDDAAAVKAAILSLRASEELDWEKLIHEASPVETILRGGKGYSALDERSRELCVRKAVGIARSLGLCETEAAEAAVKLASKGKGKKGYAEYYLTSEGEEQLRKTLSPKRPRTGPGPKAMFAAFVSAYVVLTLLLSAAFLKTGILTAALNVFPASFIALSVVSTVFGLLKKPRRTVRLAVDNARGEFSTAAAVPVLLIDEKAVADALETLETHYLANRLDGASFILLGDLSDSDTKTAPEDGKVTDAAVRGIEKLNRVYGERFFLLLREREKNADGVFQGHERKRGAVTALCRLLAGKESSFSVVYPNKELRAKYLAVLDADTVMPCGTLSELIGAAAHPVNRPEISNGRRIGGYSVFVPRMRTTARSAGRSFFARLASSDAGYELYSTAASNLHMDLYNDGDFGGKGILNIKPFLELTEGRIPDNTVLSHDLLEGSLAGAAYLNDVVLYDGEPATLPKWWKRQERWIRGDWQLIPFIFGRRGKTLSVIDRAKMLGNLLRSLREPISFLLILTGAAIGSAPVVAFTLASLIFEPVKGFVLLAVGSMKERAAADRWIMNLIRTLVEIGTLPYAAYMSLTAIVSALFRTLVSHRKMLLWQTAAASKADEKGVVSANIFGVLLTAAATALSLPKGGATNASILAFLFSAVCTIAPAIVRAIDRDAARVRPTDEEKRLAMKLFSKGWRFFEEQCVDATNYLPPDNLQEYPRKPFSDLTSPTDVGMGLVALVCAHDLRTVGDGEFILRAGKMLASVEGLEKWHGIPFNWYSVTRLETYSPRFVSSVDAGNLAASLAVLGKALGEIGANEQAEKAFSLFDDMELNRLFDPKRKLFYVGFNADEGRMTASHYDLYASEARLLSFIAAAKGEVMPQHWHTLSRLMKDAPGGRTLMSWSGTAFEYLMPLIFFETTPGSLQYEIALSAVRTQILNSKEGVPWGVSESGYYAFDRALNYQYKAFGEPSLALERRKERPRVTAPYASALALFAEPHEAMRNIAAIVKLGASGRYGLYEAIDYEGDKPRFVRSFMAHHKGMELAAYSAYLTGGRIAKRFGSIPIFRAAEQLLFEELPLKPIVIRAYESSVGEAAQVKNTVCSISPDPDSVDCALLSNGKRFVHILSDGTGVSGLGETLLTDTGGVAAFIRCGKITAKLVSDPVFSAGSAEFSAEADGVFARLKTFVAHSFDAEVRELTVINRSKEEKTVRAGFFFRPVMVSEREYAAHPAFVRLTTDAKERDGAVFFRRRKKRGRDELYLYAGLFGSDVRYTSDAFTVPGRLSSFKTALSENRGGAFAEKPIEPCFGAMTELVLEPSGSEKLLFIMGASPSIEKASADLEELRSVYTTQMELSAASAKGMLHEARLEYREYAEFGRLAARIIKRAPFGKAISERRGGGVKALWELGISGDLPIVVMIADREEHVKSAARFSKFAALASQSGLRFDAVVLSSFPAEYGDRNRTALFGAVSAPVRLVERAVVGEERANALLSLALIGAYADELPVPFAKPMPDRPERGRVEAPEGRELTLQNRFGGFDTEAGEYVIVPGPFPTPAPWSNILANEGFGALVTENGGGYSWCGNSRLGRLSEWSCDPIFDPPGEEITVVLNGREYGIASRECEVSHGFGYSAFRCTFCGIESELIRFTDHVRPLEYFLIRLVNRTGTDREAEAVLRVKWAMGEYPHGEALGFSESDGVLKVFSSRGENDGRYAFIAGGDRIEKGAAVKSTAIGAFKSVKAVFILGMADEKSVGEYAEKLTDAARAEAELETVKAVWRERLSRIRVKTGDAGFDIPVNGALHYQIYSSRLFAKTGFYQSGGAVGFRDRLQDSAALLLTDPERAREILLDSARMQFEEGDVLHWRHDNGLGVRTRISDDRLFLPFAVTEYALVTGDESVWDESVPFLSASELGENERDRCTYFIEYVENADVFEHCVRAVKRSAVFGPHGIPLMGAGDWNDGFDEMGGESCFNGWFLLFVLGRFIPVCIKRGERALARELTDIAVKLREDMEKTWEGDRYFRAIRADGTKLGSKASKECSMDLLSSVWAVFCGAKHSEEAFDTAMTELFDEENGVLRLLAPPFTDSGENGVGYIESYIEGVRENGGQYTHAAAWAVIAACRLKRADTARKLFDALNPITHGASPEKYAVEPYVAAGDVGGCGEVLGRGGWTWYTGAAGWLWTAAVRHILGIKKTGRLLKVEPVTELDSFEVSLRYGSSVYEISASRGPKASYETDGIKVGAIELKDDGEKHAVRVVFDQ